MSLQSAAYMSAKFGPVPVIAANAFSFGVQPFLDRAVSGISQVANSLIPNTPVPFDMLLRSRTVGLIGYPDLRELAKFHGISVGPREKDADWGKWWTQCLKSTIPVPSPQIIEDMWRTEYLEGMFEGTDREDDDTILSKSLERAGITYKQWKDYIKDVDSPLTFDQLIYLYWVMQHHPDRPDRAERYNAAWFNREFARIGVKSSDLQSLLKDWTGNVDFSTVVEGTLRGVWNVEGFNRQMTRLGIFNEDQRRAAELALKPIPPLTDILQMAVKEGWDAETVERFGYDAEFPAEFAHWMTKLGYNWGEDVPGRDGRVIPGVAWPQLYWRAHWQTISPTQSYEMLQRLNANNIWRFRRHIPGVQQWTLDDTKQILKVADYPPAFRDRLAAISYNPLGTRIVRRMFTASIHANNLVTDYMSQFAKERGDPEALKAEFAKFQALDQGYSPPDADLYSALLVAEDKIAREAPIRAREKQQADKQSNLLLEGYSQGIVSEEIIKNSLSALGWKEGSINLALYNANLARQLAMGRSLIARVKADFFSGIYDGGTAKQHLVNSGITLDWANWYVNSWSIVFSHGRRQFTTEKIVRLYVEGFITNQAAVARLLNIGWTNVDTLLLLAEGNARIANANAKVVQAGNKAQERTAKELERIARQHATDIEKVRGNLRRIYPLTKLNRLLKLGKLDQDSYNEKLKLQGYDDEAIALQLLDMIPEKDYTETTLRALLKAELITDGEFAERMKQFGYDTTETDRIRQLVIAKPSTNGQTTGP